MKKKKRERTWQEKTAEAEKKVKAEILPALSNIKLGRSAHKVTFSYKGENYVLSEKGVLASVTTLANGKKFYQYGGTLNSELDSREREALKRQFLSGYDRDKQKNIYKIPTIDAKKSMPDTDIIPLPMQYFI